MDVLFVGLLSSGSPAMSSAGPRRGSRTQIASSGMHCVPQVTACRPCLWLLAEQHLLRSPRPWRSRARVQFLSNVLRRGKWSAAVWGGVGSAVVCCIRCLIPPRGFWVDELALVLGSPGSGAACSCFAFSASSNLRLIPTASACWNRADNEAKSQKRGNTKVIVQCW